MKNLALTLLLLSSLSHGATKAIYGEDSRIDVEDSPDPVHKELANSVAAMIPGYVTDDEVTPGFSSFFDLILKDTSGVCSEEKFSHQQTVSTCTGFLVGPKLLATAGHCVTSIDDCHHHQWVFDYKLKSGTESLVGSIPHSSIYKCTKILGTQLTKKEDWALVELDRPVTGRHPLRIKSSAPKNGHKVFVIGTPSGLPLKVATGKVISKRINYFRTNLDTFSGNSGSPVFNIQNEVIGILVRGHNDYDEKPGKCTTATQFEESRGREDVSYLKDILKIIAE